MESSAWVFGYGSLIWRADFPWLARQPATLTGWARRFWQGSHDHRGVPDAPGRVVTLVPVPDETCGGVAYRVESDVFDHLDHREKNGYERIAVGLKLANGENVNGVVYVAPTGNFAFLGDAPLEEMAHQIRDSSGPSGSNIDYLFELAAALRNLGTEDPHVFALEAAVRKVRD